MRKYTETPRDWLTYMVFADDETFERELKIVEDLALIGNADALCTLSQICRNRKLRVFDPDRAFDLCTKAAKKGHVEAQHDLSQIYRNKLDKENEIYWLHKAAENGYAISQWILGNKYLYGNDVKKDHKRALKLLNAAVKQDFAYAYWSLAEYYENENKDFFQGRNRKMAQYCWKKYYEGKPLELTPMPRD